MEILRKKGFIKAFIKDGAKHLLKLVFTGIEGFYVPFLVAETSKD